MANDDPFYGADNGPSFQVVEAVREAVPSLTALWGFSDSGKTYSALRYARGLVGPQGRIVGIDTENKRMKFYSGMFGGFGHIDLQPPFTPQRYTAAVEAAVAHGANAIIIDSGSHVWQGEGGVLEQADARKPGIGKWAPKIPYTRMVYRMLRSPVHMIFCLRAKEHYVQKGKGKDAEIEHLGQIPIFGAGFVHEMTVSVRMESNTRKPLTVKAPDPIANVIQIGEFITEKHGERIASWLAGGSPVDHEVTVLQASARDVASTGSIKFRDWWRASLVKGQRDILQAIIPELRDLASQADADMARAASEEAATESVRDPFDDEFTKAAA